MKNWKIAFYIELAGMKKILENANIDDGNPGIGGTQYLFLLTVQSLNRLFGDYAVLLTDCEMEMKDSNIPSILVGKNTDAIKYCENNGISVLVFNANVLGRMADDAFNTSIRIFAWAHNTMTWKRQLIAAKTNSIERIVCVSESQCINMQDTPCWDKCVYVNNVIPKQFYEQATVTDYSEPKVIYIGSIMAQKGLHNLLDIWRYVEAEVPEAQLYIVGGANVWNASVALGKSGIADPYYEKIIAKKMKKIKNQKNIHFMGSMGWNEIDKIFRTGRVGVVNPSYYLRDETFCMSAIEMEAHGLPVISRERYDGLHTTILHGKTGYLEKKDKGIATRMIQLLRDKKRCMSLGEKAREYAKRFLADTGVIKWHDLVEENRTPKSFDPQRKYKKSRDGKLLDHDLMLKIGYTIESGEVVRLWERMRRYIKMPR